jgi:hypothetical protein
MVPTAAADAGPAPQSKDCDPIGSYGLRLLADVDWPGPTSSDSPGRGQVELYGLVQVAARDAQTHALTTSARLCGLELPPIDTSETCSTSQLRFADTLWDLSTLPRLTLSSHYDCAATGCVMQIEPTSYALGIDLADPQATWPTAGMASAAVFRDDDHDGYPGVTADIAALSSSSPSGNGACPGNSSASPMTTQGTKSSAMSWGLTVSLGLRVEFMAALTFAPTCELDSVSGALQEVGLRAAGCPMQNETGEPFQPPMAAGEANAGCPDDVRNAIDQRLPQYHVLGAGEAPAAPRSALPGRATVVQALRLAGGTPITCRQVRDAMF